MPIYAYRCEACGHAVDLLRKVSDPPLSVCPACGADAFRKQVTAAGFQLKGSGWYVTDFRGGPQGAKPDGKAESKPEAKSGSESGKAADVAASPAVTKADSPAPAPSVAPTAPAPAPAASGSSGTAK
jgi:putative FmdB family regulatory protein